MQRLDYKMTKTQRLDYKTDDDKKFRNMAPLALFGEPPGRNPLRFEQIFSKN